MPPDRQASTTDWILFIVPSFIWGTTWLAIKFQLGVVPPEASVAYRFGAASALLLGWCVVRRVPLRFDLRTHASLALLGILQFALNYVLVYLAEVHLTSGLVALVFGLLVLWNLAGARVFFGSRVSAGVALGAALGLCGVTLVLWPDISHVRRASEQGWGVALALAGTVTASAGNLWSQRLYRRGAAVVPSTAWAMLYGAGSVALYCALRGVRFTFDASLPYLASLAYLALFGSVFAFVTYLSLLRRIGAGRSGYTAVVIPVLAMATSTVFEGYRWSAGPLAGMLLVLASETTALDLLEAEYVREVEPGELVVLDADGMRSERLFPDQRPPQRFGRCVFEHIYFARPDSVLFGRSVYSVRQALGRRLAQERPAQADLVIPVPDSGVPAAIGYSEESGIPFAMGLVRSHYVGRTFIEPQQSIRHFGVKLKLNALRDVLRGKRVVVVDDSVVRGTTSRKIVKMIRDAGASEVHLRISSPPTSWPCYYGIDTPTRQELIASTHSVEEIETYVTADSLGYLSMEGLYSALGEERRGFCDACLSGEYLLSFPHRQPSPTPLRVVGT